MAKFHIEPDQVTKVANDVSTMSTSFKEIKTYTAQSQLAPGHFGKIPGLSEAAGAYVAKMQALGDSAAKGSTFLGGFAERLNTSVTLHSENEQENAWGVTNAGKGA
ncbi:hypothetical protein [Amycolatopsis echigonensis]|uniref:Excreted virulence factor EspC (Type VII ESX diderm) n=1 Tax=Amycolatopsis echigonensis TaxID=2576905 RepID=A0A2N3WDY0_9PSEU|nr:MULTISPECIES: hypothetical protein [Amycolatopsis]MBB2500976.1 hypothetical protein [Amycolatopsis echigonensis]PKV92063.1 hypothetical protein ATK30_2852 [Amycolatopsis niigatensis]